MIYEIYNIEISGKDLYLIVDFNKNNLISNIPISKIIYKNEKCTIYGVGKLSAI